jgi:hypothetical protein
MELAARLPIRMREYIVGRVRAQGTIEYTLIVLGVFLVYVSIMAVWAAIQSDPR